jgi:hypothetical protein
MNVLFVRLNFFKRSAGKIVNRTIPAVETPDRYLLINPDESGGSDLGSKAIDFMRPKVE